MNGRRAPTGAWAGSPDASRSRGPGLVSGSLSERSSSSVAPQASGAGGAVRSETVTSTGTVVRRTMTVSSQFVVAATQTNPAVTVATSS